MKIKNFEFKAKTANPDKLEKKLLTLKPFFKGEDHQIDTYFNVHSGRLKLREGNIENALIYYERPDVPDSKQADIILYRHSPETSLKDILTKVHGIKAVVDKTRRIYFLGNVKFHFDIVKNLGKYVEVEAIDENGDISPEKLKEQCDKYFSFFDLNMADFIDKSYSDLILEKNSK